MLITTDGGSNIIYQAEHHGSILNRTMKHGLSFSMQHYGEFEIMISTENNVSKLSKPVKVIIMKPVMRIKDVGIIVPYISNVSALLPIKITIKEGSDIRCQVDFGDGEATTLPIQKAEYYTGMEHRNKENYKNIRINIFHAFARKRGIQRLCFLQE